MAWTEKLNEQLQDSKKSVYQNDPLTGDKYFGYNLLWRTITVVIAIIWMDATGFSTLLILTPLITIRLRMNEKTTDKNLIKRLKNFKNYKWRIIGFILYLIFGVWLIIAKNNVPLPVEESKDFKFRSISQSGENAIISILYYTGDIYGNWIKLERDVNILIFKWLKSWENAILLSGLYNQAKTSLIYKSKEQLEQERVENEKLEKIKIEAELKIEAEKIEAEKRIERLTKEKEAKKLVLQKKYERLCNAGLYQFEIEGRLGDESFYLKSSDFAKAPDGGTSVKQTYTKTFDNIIVEISLQSAYDIGRYYCDVTIW